MFIRTFSLLLLTIVVLVEPVKIDEILKKVGKRYLGEKDLLDWEGRYLDWSQKTDEQVDEMKDAYSMRVIKDLVQVSSKEHAFYKVAMMQLTALMNPDMEVKVCGGDGDKTMTSYQYTKYLTQSANQYKNTPIKFYNYSILETGRDELAFKVYVSHTDKFDIETEIEYHVTMDLTLGQKIPNKVFTISHIYQGGSCGEHGKVAHTRVMNEREDDVKELKEHPAVSVFFELFTPGVYQDLDPNRLPKHWLNALVKGESKINVCQEGVKDTVEYTTEQFSSWFNHFGLMWHQKKDDANPMELQMIEMKDDAIVARVTMKLQMGRDENAQIHEWNFKFSAKEKPDSDGSKSWKIAKLEVLCTPTIDYKDQSLVSIRDVIAGKFLDRMQDLPSPFQYYSTVDFVQKFTKHGKVVVYICEREVTGWTTQLTFYVTERKQKSPSKFLRYWFDNDVTLPAEDTSTFKFKTLMEADSDNPKWIYENEWKFEMKWDQMDQFYYIEKVNVGCYHKILKETIEMERFKLAGDWK